MALGYPATANRGPNPDPSHDDYREQENDSDFVTH